MMSETKDADRLLDELTRLAAAGKVRDFTIGIDIEKLPRREQEYAHLLDTIFRNCKAAAEYDLIKYRLSNDALGIAHWDMDVNSADPVNPDNKFTWSREFRRMIGFSGENDFPDVLSSWSSRLHPEDKERVLGALAAHLVDVTGNTPYNLEYRMKTKSGTYRSFRAVGLTMRDDKGAPLKVAGALEDITGRVEQQEMLENILNAMDSYIYTTDLETDEMLFANKKMTADFRLGKNTRGDKCWHHLQLGQEARCPWCKKDEVRKNPGKPVTWEEDNQVTGSSLYKIDRIIDWPGGRKVHMQQAIDITEMKRAEEALLEREKKLDTLNRAAIIILSRKDDAFEDAMTEGVSLISGIAGFDRMSVFRGNEGPGGLCLSRIYGWNRKPGAPVITPDKFTGPANAGLFPRWKKLLAAGECINGPARLLPEAKALEEFGCASLLAVPVLNGGDFWGFAFFENLTEERNFTPQETDILRSASFMLANVVIRNEEAKKIRAADEHVKLLLDATPLACRLWNRDFNLVECNQAAVNLFGLRDKQEYMERYFELSPEYQPDGQSTREKIREVVSEVFEKGDHTYQWMYRMTDGTPIPAEITMVRIPYGDDYVVAAYSRDMREQKKMMAEIEHRDNLLDTSRRVSFILFDTAEDKDIEAVLTESMELLGRCVGVDQVYITQNEMVNGVPHFTCKSAWVSDPGRIKSAIAPGMKFPWGLDLDWDRRFRQGECMNGPVKNLPKAIQGFFAPFETRSVLVVPVFVQEQFWGLVGFSDCGRDRSFGADDVDILRSMSLIMAAAVNRNEQATAIRDAHNRNRLLTNATPLSFNLWDKNLENIETNDTAVNLFGLKHQREYLERFYELSPEYQSDGSLSREKANALVHKAFREGYCQFEWTHQKLDGTLIPAEITLVRLAYGDDYVVAGYIRDIREHKQMIAEIERRDYLRATVNQVADMLLRTEPDGFLDTLGRCMGMLAEAIHADRMYIAKNHIKDNKLYRTQLHEWSENAGLFQDTGALIDICYDETTPKIKERLSRGEFIHSLVRDLSPAGQKWLGAQGILAVLLVPVFIQEEFWGFIGFENRHSEELFTENEESIMCSGSLTVANALLRNEYMLSIRDTSAKLEAALADAEEANNAKSDFLAHMSHEIRTPLNAVVGLSELVLDNDILDSETENKLEKIHDSGMTILNIVNDILDISKIESGKFELNPIRYDTPSLINDTVTLNIVRIGEKPVTFKINVDENLPGALYGDDLRVKQVFNNLLSNAFKYTHSGTVEWQISSEQDGDNVWLISSVRDTGIGIKPEDLEKLFSAYNQVDTKRNRKVEGTGLGLVITKRLVEMMNGTITVESEYGRGSAFHVRLRQALASDVPIGKALAKNLMDMRYTLVRRNRNTKLVRVNMSYAHVLVVDDIATNLDVVKGMLKPYGIKVDCAISGQQAVEMIRAENPRYNAVFMDHMMPGMDGIEATRIIREEAGTDYARNIPVIALTANAIVGNEEMFLGKGFQAFISKPIDIMKLDFILRQWVRDKKLEQEPWNTDEDTHHQPKNEGDLTISGITINGIDTSRALERFGGDKAVLIDVLRSYTANTPPLLRSLREYLEAENLDDYTIVVHGIKGASYGICAQAAGKAAETLEAAAKAGNLSAVKAGHSAFEKRAEELIASIQKTLDTADSAAGKPAAAEPDPALLQELREACKAFEMDRVDAVMDRLESVQYERGGKIILWLREQVNNMAFEEIAGNEWPDE